MVAQMAFRRCGGKAGFDASWKIMARQKTKIPGFTKIPNGKLTSALHPLFTKE
ncbi:hypothetical protein [Sphingobium sp.]|uniref:hypothetical protein n=1 Tax=Sphingobium sp. TaxID=1912891 RepID=UPI0028BE4C0F|nr:hypothetical protein [Sphingobium sp.]